MISALLQVEQALLDVFWPQRGVGLGLKDQLLPVAPNDEIYPALGHQFAFVDDGHFDLALKLQASLPQGNLQGALVI